jgi:hypothetical protein
MKSSMTNEQREKILGHLRDVMKEKGYGAATEDRFMNFVTKQMPSVIEKFAESRYRVERALQAAFAYIPPDADASIQPVLGDSPDRNSGK